RAQEELLGLVVLAARVEDPRLPAERGRVLPVLEERRVELRLGLARRIRAEVAEPELVEEVRGRRRRVRRVAREPHGRLEVAAQAPRAGDQARGLAEVVAALGRVAQSLLREVRV